MLKHQTIGSSVPKKRITNKIIAGFTALVVTTFITASGFAAATSPHLGKPSKEDCRRAGFSNYGQCVKEWAHHKNKPGHGYGGGNSSIATNISLALNNSNNNVITIIVNIFR